MLINSLSRGSEANLKSPWKTEIYRMWILDDICIPAWNVIKAWLPLQNRTDCTFRLKCSVQSKLPCYWTINWTELRVEPVFIQLKWFGHLIQMPSGHQPRFSGHGMPSSEETITYTNQEISCISHLELSQDPTGGIGKPEERILLNITLGKKKKIDTHNSCLFERNFWQLHFVIKVLENSKNSFHH